MGKGEFVKRVIFPVVSVLFLAMLFRPLCMENGEYDYFKLWFFIGIPFGIHRMFLWIIPKGYDIGGTMGVLAANLLIGSAIGCIVIIWRLGVAIVYLAKMTVTGIICLIKKSTGKPDRT